MVTAAPSIKKDITVSTNKDMMLAGVIIRPVKNICLLSSCSVLFPGLTLIMLAESLAAFSYQFRGLFWACLNILYSLEDIRGLALSVGR
jgi:hypothetical protein